jgi:2,3-bisphosphoglycerate-dependent phosphoglycerate mutase
MICIYFVRHAQPDHDWEDDRTRPLTEEGLVDRRKVTDVLRDIRIDAYFSSPYKRTIDTIKESAGEHHKNIVTDERLRERKKGPGGNELGMFQKRWSDFDFHEPGGESLNMVQKRNIEALMEILGKISQGNVVLGTHGTALSTILNYFNPLYCCGDFLRIIDFMPYIIRLDFDETILAGKEEILIIEKEFKGSQRADKT